MGMGGGGGGTRMMAWLMWPSNQNWPNSILPLHLCSSFCLAYGPRLRPGWWSCIKSQIFKQNSHNPLQHNANFPTSLRCQLLRTSCPQDKGKISLKAWTVCSHDNLMIISGQFSCPRTNLHEDMPRVTCHTKICHPPFTRLLCKELRQNLDLWFTSLAIQAGVPCLLLTDSVKHFKETE